MEAPDSQMQGNYGGRYMFTSLLIQNLENYMYT